MAASILSTSTAQHLNNTNKNYTTELTILTSLFFMWGFLTYLNYILIPHLKAVFSLNYAQAMLIQFCFLGAYALSCFMLLIYYGMKGHIPHFSKKLKVQNA